VSATTLSFMIESGVLDARLSWSEFESLAVRMGRELSGQALASVLEDSQGCGGRRCGAYQRRLGARRCATAEDFARRVTRTRKRTLHAAASTVELVLWHVGCRDCGRVFSPPADHARALGQAEHRDRLMVDLAELGTQVSFTRAAGLSRELAGTTATAGRAHNALADTAALLSGTDDTLRPGHPSPDVVMLDGTGARVGANKNGVGVRLALGLPGRSGPTGGAGRTPTCSGSR
jgi:hypothetical protein